jgi:hypothetical protein
VALLNVYIFKFLYSPGQKNVKKTEHLLIKTINLATLNSSIYFAAPASSFRHIIVQMNGRLFNCTVLDENYEPYTAPEIERYEALRVINKY